MPGRVGLSQPSGQPVIEPSPFSASGSAPTGAVGKRSGQPLDRPKKTLAQKLARINAHRNAAGSRMIDIWIDWDKFDIPSSVGEGHRAAASQRGLGPLKDCLCTLEIRSAEDCKDWLRYFGPHNNRSSQQVRGLQWIRHPSGQGGSWEYHFSTLILPWGDDRDGHGRMCPLAFRRWKQTGVLKGCDILVQNFPDIEFMRWSTGPHQFDPNPPCERININISGRCDMCKGFTSLARRNVVGHVNSNGQWVDYPSNDMLQAHQNYAFSYYFKPKIHTQGILQGKLEEAFFNEQANEWWFYTDHPEYPRPQYIQTMLDTPGTDVIIRSDWSPY